MQYTITLTEAENKAMEHIAYNVQDWIDNSVKNRARISMDDIYTKEVTRMTNDPDITEIPANKEAVVLLADIRTVKEVADEELKTIKPE